MIERIGMGGRKYYYQRFTHRKKLSDGTTELKYCYVREDMSGLAAAKIVTAMAKRQANRPSSELETAKESQH